MTVAQANCVRVALELGCSDTCNQFAWPLYRQLAGGDYRECSVLQIPRRLSDWRDAHRTARKRADRAHRLGYRFAHVERHRYAHDIHAINTSLEHRQGRRMTNGYWQPPSTVPDPLPTCPLHGVHPYGVLLEKTLVAYVWIYRAGDLALVSQILGHGDHLRNDVMYLLMEGALDKERVFPGWMVYNLHSSGTDGLRYFKERLGFQATTVEWAA